MRVPSRGDRVTGSRVAGPAVTAGPAAAAAAVLAALTVLAAASACDTSANPGSHGGGASRAATGTSGTPTATGVAAGTTLTTRTGPHGTILTDSAGRTLYGYSADTRSATTSCIDVSCSRVWPPVTSAFAPVAGRGVTSSMLGMSPRDDGTNQVTYGGHPLYYFSGDTAPGDTKGQGVDRNGKFWLVDPAGRFVTR